MELPSEQAHKRRVLSLLTISGKHQGADLNPLRILHACIIRLRLHRTCNFTVGNLVSRFAALGLMPYAVRVFEQMKDPNFFVWNSLVNGFLQNRRPGTALLFFRSMQARHVPCDRFTFLNAVRACADLKHQSNGRCVHGQIVKVGWGLDTRVGSCLIEFYSSCGDMAAARQMFEEMHVRDSISWTVTISGYVNDGDMENARKLFEEMPGKDLVVWSLLIAGYVKIGDVSHALDLFHRSPSRDLLMYNTMLGGFARLGDVNSLLHLFEDMPVRDVVSWNTAISGFVQGQKIREAMALFQRMQLEGRHPNEVTLATLLSGCAQAGALDLGRLIHSYIVSKRDGLSLYDHPTVGTALVDMYSKCGKLPVAWSIFSGMGRIDAAAWNAMIAGLCANGQSRQALNLFQQMQMENVRPNRVTMVGVLSACAHAGLVEEGRRYFNYMANELGILPEVEHYGCMVDLLGRAGLLGEAHKLACSMPMEPHAGVWGALLGACRIHGEVELAEQAMERLLELGSDDGGYLAIMGNIYGDAGRWEDAERVRKLMTEKGFIKAVGHSAVEVNDRVRELALDGNSFQNSNHIYKEDVRYI